MFVSMFACSGCRGGGVHTTLEASNASEAIDSNSHAGSSPHYDWLEEHQPSPGWAHNVEQGERHDLRGGLHQPEALGL